MECRSRCYLFIKKPKNGEKHCIHCQEDIQDDDLIYSKRGRRYYCSKCAFRLGYIGATR